MMAYEVPSGRQRGGVSEEAGRRALRRRQWRVWRSIALFVVVTLAMIVLSIMNRDEAAIRSCETRMEVAAEALQAMYDRGRPIPPTLPLPEDAGPNGERQQRVIQLRGHVYFNVFHSPHTNPARNVGVCCCRWPHTRLVGQSGRHVIVFDPNQQRYIVRWFDETEFEQLAPELGLSHPLEADAHR